MQCILCQFTTNMFSRSNNAISLSVLWNQNPLHAWITQYFIVTFECSSQRVIVPTTLLQSISLCVCLHGRPLCLIFHLVLSVVVQWLVKWCGESLWSFVLGAGVTDWAERKGHWALNQPEQLTIYFYFFFIYFFACRFCAHQEMCTCKWFMIHSYEYCITLNGLIFRTQVYWFHTDNLFYWSTKVTLNLLYCTSAYTVSWKLEACEIGPIWW